MRAVLAALLDAPLRDPDDAEPCAPFSVRELRDMDDEGRLVVTDHALFVLINAYFPRASEDEPARYHFKKRFQQAIKQAVMVLTHVCGREVVVVGDLNICHKPIDHCDPANSIRENKLDAFGDTMGRRWMDALLEPPSPPPQPSGEPSAAPPPYKLVDVFRHLHPTRRAAYTCWNTLIGARTANFGTRLDYILVSRPLLRDWVAACAVRADVFGSDHCPVVMCLRAAHATSGETLTVACARGQRALRAAALQGGAFDEVGLMESEMDFDSSPALPPPGCAELWDSVRWAGAQTSLTTWVSTGKKRTLHTSKDDGSFLQEAEHGKSSESEHQQQQHLQSQKPQKAQKTQKAQKLQKGLQPAQPSVAAFFKRAGTSNISDDSVTPLVSPTKPPEPTTTTPRISASSSAIHASASEWKLLMTRPDNPKCWHGEETKEFRVNKTGPNQGRYFYLCKRPVGPTADVRYTAEVDVGLASQSPVEAVAGKTAGRKTVGEFRCNFFQWKKQQQQQHKKT